MINGSRQVSQWFDSGALLSAQRLEDGSPIDKAVYGSLIVAGLCVIIIRRVQLGQVLRNNPWIALFILYEGFSVLWSDFPLVTFKRWVKALGDPVMILVLWSDPFPTRAITAVMKRCAYVLIPLSVLFCKYYENLGRTFEPWGTFTYTGVTTNKNMLGYLLFAFGLFFTAALIAEAGKSRENTRRDRSAQLINVAFLIMIGWLLLIANSKTATLALAVGIAFMLASRSSTVRKYFWSVALTLILFGTISDALFSVSGTIVQAVGRDLTFTGRTGLWQTVLEEPVNPLVGVGYASFWLGERLTRFWAMYPNSPPTQAHNGYLELYLNLGLIGVFLLAGVLVAGLTRMRRRLAPSLDMSATFNDRVVSTFGIAYGMAYLFYNITEATFQGLNTLFVIFLILAFHYQQPDQHVLRHSAAKESRRQVYPQAREPNQNRSRVRPAARWRRPVAKRAARQPLGRR